MHILGVFTLFIIGYKCLKYFISLLTLKAFCKNHLAFMGATLGRYNFNDRFI